MMIVTQNVPSVYVLVTIPMKYLTTFWESVDLTLINYDQFGFSDGFYSQSDIQDYIKQITKKPENFTTTPSTF